MTEHKLHLFSRSDVEEFWRCPRASYWRRVYGGRGLEMEGDRMELVTGTILHDSIHRIFQGDTPEEVAIRAGELLEAEWRIQGLPAGVVEDSDRPEDFFREMNWWMTAAVYGVYKMILPQLNGIGTVECVEKEMLLTDSRGVSGMMTTPDVLILPHGEDEYLYVEWKTVKKAGYGWFMHWQFAPQFMAVAKAVEETLGKRVNLCQVVGILKGDWFDGWLHSQFVWCWAFDGPGGVELAWKWEDARRKGWVRTPAWDLVDSPIDWVKMMPQGVLELQYPVAGPFPVQEYQAEAFVRQVFGQEESVAACKRIETEGRRLPEQTLDWVFPQHFTNCETGWSTCWAKELCWQPAVAVDPIGSGKFFWRVSHHKMEVENGGGV